MKNLFFMSFTMTIFTVGCGVFKKDKDSDDKPKDNPVCLSCSMPDPPSPSPSPTPSGDPCGDGYKVLCSTIPPSPSPTPECLTSIPAEVEALQVEEKKLRDEALNKERERLKVKPVKLETKLSEKDPGSKNFNPYPGAVPVLEQLKPEEKNEKYKVFHGWEGARTGYETKPGSKIFYIVDELIAAGNDLIKTTGEHALHESDVDDYFHHHTESYHSWHVTDDNQLVRAAAKVSHEVVKSISVCGCGPDADERPINTMLQEAGPSATILPRPKGIFILPGKTEPKLLDKPFEATYKVKTIDIKYVPKAGHQCVPRIVVC